MTDAPTTHEDHPMDHEPPAGPDAAVAYPAPASEAPTGSLSPGIPP